MSGRLKVNIGNIHFKQGKYHNAIQLYKKGVDQIPKQFKQLRMNVMKNIGHASLKLGRYSDAIQAYEDIMENMPDHQTCFNLFLC